MSSKWIFSHSKKSQSGLTLIELMVGVAISGVIFMIALPNLSPFIIKTRVDNGILELHRLVLSARNAAISSEQNVTLCPLSTALACTNNWEDELTVFIDIDADSVYEPLANETIIKVRSALNADDNMQSAVNNLTYTATGQLTGAAANINFNYCPPAGAGVTVNPRAVIVSATGRPSLSEDTNRDDIDEDRNGANIVCI